MRRPSFHIARLVARTCALLAACGGGAGGPAAAAPPSAPAPSTACDSATGRVLRVGPGKPFAVPSAAAAVAQSGDVIVISAGDYRGDVTRWSASKLTICGAGGRARLFADGRNAAGKGIWVIGGSDVTVDSIEFHDAKVPDRNGAGIRAEHTGKLSIRNCGFFDNENGILGGDLTSATISIDRSEFGRNGFGDGYSHNLYVGTAARLTVTNSFFHEARIGHNLKSRARENRIENSYFMDGTAGTSSYLADFPNGGVVFLRGNLFQKGPKADNSNAIAYAAEGLRWTVNTLEMVHNTVVITRQGGSYLSAPSGTQSVTLTGNLFAGNGNPALITGGFAQASISNLEFNHRTGLPSAIPDADNIGAPSFWPNAALLTPIRLPRVLDATTTTDSPAPFILRDVTGGARVFGAIQSAP